MADRRKHARFKINGKAHAYCRTHSSKVAEIIDISRGGLAFSYMGSAEPPNTSLELDVVFPDRTDYVEGLPCRAVSDCQIDGEAGVRTGTRRCSVEYEKLDQHHRAKIDSLIENYCWRASKDPDPS